MKNIKLMVLSVLTVGAFTFSTTASANWWTPSCPGGQLKKQGNRYQCETTSRRVPQCPNGGRKDVKQNAKDTCTKASGGAQTQAPVCKLAAGQRQNNWQLKHRRGLDYCVRKRGGGPEKTIKCRGAFTINQDARGNRDSCVKRNGQGGVAKTKVQCYQNETHKKRGRDVCESTRITKPRF